MQALTRKQKKHWREQYDLMPFKPTGKSYNHYDILPIMFKGDNHIYWRVCAGFSWQELFSSLAEAYKKAKKLQIDAETNRQIGIRAICCQKLKEYFRKYPAYRKGWQVTA